MKPIMSRFFVSTLLAMGTLVAGAESQYYTYETPYKVPVLKETNRNMPAKNVILMIGDGMGMHHTTAAWVANRGELHIFNCPVTGIARTWCSDKLITDSAASGTAIATGTKTLYGRVAISPEGKELHSLIDAAQSMGKSTGIVVTSGLNDATPAAFVANNKSRDKAQEIIADYTKSKINFIFGGGAKHFTNRSDGRDIFKEMKSKGYRVATSWEEGKKLPKGKSLIVVADDNLPAPSKRKDVLVQATKKALDTLAENKKGFFLMVEGSCIDKAAHRNDLTQVVEETLDFDQSVGVVLAWAAKRPGTLVVVTADHNTGAFAIVGGDKEKGEVKAKFNSGGHDGVSVPVYAYGAGSHKFTGVYENSDLPKKIKEAMKGIK